MNSTHALTDILPAWLAAADPWVAIPVALFLFGLVGGFAHCAGMCGPFVIAQVGARLQGRPVGDFGGLRRLQAGLLPGYHLGRLATYSILGAIASGLGGLVSELSGARWFAAGGLGVAALIFAAVAIGGLDVGSGAFGRLLANATGPLLRRAGDPMTSFAIGVLLGLLPCHMVYAALAASTALASPLGGAVAMAAFAAGTMAALAGLGMAGAAAGRRFREASHRLLPVAGLANAVLLAVLAVGAVPTG